MNTDEKKIQITAALAVSVTIAELIRELREVPSGELYARLMGKMDLETYERIITTLIGAGLIRRERSHMLVWAKGVAK